MYITKPCPADGLGGAPETTVETAPVNTVSFPQPAAAVVLAERGIATDDLMASFALALRDRGWWVRGILSTTRWQAYGGNTPVLIDIDTCTAYPACPASGTTASFDARDVATQIVDHMQDIVCNGADLAIFHRFSEIEAAGGGVAAELLLTMASGIPLLTAIHPEELSAWQAFTPHRFALLPPSLETMFAWIESVWQTRYGAASPCLHPLTANQPGLQQAHGNHR